MALRSVPPETAVFCCSEALQIVGFSGDGGNRTRASALLKFAGETP